MGLLDMEIHLTFKKEMIATPGGTIPETSIIRINNSNQYETTNLNEMMNGSVTFNQTKAQFEVYYGKDKQAERYKLHPKGMEFVGYIAPIISAS
jgi:hypothetical protein